MEGIGLALDIPGDRMFMTDLGGSLYTGVWTARLTKHCPLFRGT